MTLGVTIGKFYPFHLGHNYLIQQAKQQVDKLVVLVGYKTTQGISGKDRGQWIKIMHPDVEVIEVIDDLPEAPEPWAIRTLEVLQGRAVDFVFTSEDYGEPWAKLMGAKHIPIDPQRVKFPISGTQLRDSLSTHWSMLTPPAKAYFSKRICVLGVESSGTTTLAEALAQHYKTVWVPEYGRWYCVGKEYTLNQHEWDSYEFIKIAEGQAAWEDDLAFRANKLVICDTDPLATHLWHRRYLGFDSPLVEKIADSRRYDLYILTEPDFGFVQDGTRDGEAIRMTMHQWFVDILKAKGKTYITVEGSLDSRIAKATDYIDSLLKFPRLNP